MYKHIRLLDERELKLLANIDEAVKKKFHYNGDSGGFGGSESKTGQFMEKLSAMEENLKEIMLRIKEKKLSIKRFVETYPEWRKNRIKCIAKLEQIAKSLDKDRFNFNIAKMFGLCLSLAGGAGLIAVGLNAELAPQLGVASATLTGTGAGIVVFTSITETVRVVRKVEKAKKMIQKDQFYFESMREWLEQADELQEALVNVLDIDIMKVIADSTKKFVRKAIKIKKDHQRLTFIEKNVKRIISMLGEDIDIPVAAIGTAIKILTTVVLLLCKTENRFVFDFASVTMKSLVVVGLLVENSVDAFGLASRLAVESAQLLRVATGVVGMTLDVICVVKTSVDIHRKSRSPEARKITIAAQELNEDVENLDNIYKRLSELKE